MENLRSLAVSTAHKIKEYIPSWGNAQKAGWLIAKLSLQMEQDICFVKDTGEVREAHVQFASLKAIESGLVRFVELIDGSTQWRSFRVERLMIGH